jgi:hypothetical protein
VRILLVIALAAGVSCSSAEPSGTGPGAAPTQVTGLITELTYEGEQMTSLVVESREGSVEILIDPEYDYGFNLDHLEKHRTKGQPVQVALESRDDGLYAVDILDA